MASVRRIRTPLPSVLLLLLGCGVSETPQTGGTTSAEDDQDDDSPDDADDDNGVPTSSSSSSSSSSTSSGAEPSTGSGGDAPQTGTSTGRDTPETSGNEESSSGLDAVCGDGIVDGDEACDDGNGEIADGCELDCTLTADTLEWSHAAVGEGRRFRDVVIDGGESAWAIGEFATDEMLLRRFSPTGETLFSTTIQVDAGDTHQGATISLNASGSALVAGMTDNGYPSIAEVDSDGQHLWSQFGQLGNEPNAVQYLDSAVTPDGDLILVGSVVRPNHDGYMTRATGLGSMVWGGVLGATPIGYNETLRGVAIDGAGNIYCVMNRFAGHDGSPEALAYKLSPAGMTLWNSDIVLASSSFETGIDLELLPNGGVLVAGTRELTDHSGAWFAELSEDDGTPLQIDYVTLPSPSPLVLRSLDVSPGGARVAVGETRFVGSGETLAWVRAWDSDGVVQWTQYVSGPEGATSLEANSVGISDDGAVVVVGQVVAGNSITAWIAKLAP